MIVDRLSPGTETVPPVLPAALVSRLYPCFPAQREAVSALSPADLCVSAVFVPLRPKRQIMSKYKQS